MAQRGAGRATPGQTGAAVTRGAFHDSDSMYRSSTPSRSAQGAHLELIDVERCHRGMQDDRGRHDLERAVGRDARQLLPRGWPGCAPAAESTSRATARGSSIRSMPDQPGAGYPDELRERPDRLRRADHVVGPRLSARTSSRPARASCCACARSCSTAASPGGSSGRKPSVMRPAPSGTDAAASGSSSEPAAISSDPPPMSNSRIWPAAQPNQRRTARNVNRASVSPPSTCRRLAERLLDARDDRRAVLGLADGGGRGREQLVDLLGLGDRARFAHRLLEGARRPPR